MDAKQHIANLRSNLLVAKKVPLYTGKGGYKKPDAFGIYREGGGECLGVVRERFIPANLEFFLDAVTESIRKSKTGLDLSQLRYNEYFGGRKIAFHMPYKDVTVGNPSKGDVTKLGLSFRTGFDGKTRFTIASEAFRLWCENGCGNWESEVILGFKNTKLADVKVALFADKIANELGELDGYGNWLNELIKLDFSPEDIEAFISDLTGYEDLDEIRNDGKKARSRKRLTGIENAITTETENTGMNAYSVLQGITRYTTHELAVDNKGKLIFASDAQRLASNAHQILHYN